jgi:hypothetical protein
MPLFVYRCPSIGRQVQGFSADDVSVDAHTYEPVFCSVCRHFHNVNPATGAVLGDGGAQGARRNTPAEGKDNAQPTKS